MKTRKTNGYILHETATLVAICTGFARKSANQKTGNMLQVWFLVKAIHPVQAQHTGQDSAACGNCPLRPINALPGEAKCYVKTFQAPAGVWKAYQAGRYPQLPSTDLFLGRSVRFGAYGDPCHLPLTLLAEISSKASGWTGYTHQWRNPLFQGYRQYLMASADDVAGQIEAVKAGWRTFRVAPKGSSWRMKDEISCPASAESGHRTTCARCGLCGGASVRAKCIVIQDHHNN